MEREACSREEAEQHIKQIREGRGFVDGSEANSTNVNREDLEASISILAEGLYDKSTHFLFELIQNADDCLYNVETPEMLIGYCDGRLRVDYNEVGFTSRNVEALCRIGRTTKSNNGNQIGEKGIGFKSVFKIADVVWICSGYYSFKFDKTTTNLGMVTPEWDTFPAAPDPRYTSVLLQLRDDYIQEELLQEMRAIDPRCLLFLRNLKKIDIGIKQSLMPDWQTTLRRSDDEGSDKPRRSITLGQDDRTKTYLVRQFTTTRPPYEPKRPRQKKSSVLLAFPCIDVQDDVLESQQVYAFLPIHDYGLKFLVHADFLLTANRKEIDSSSEWNRWLSEAILDAFMEEARDFHNTPFRYTWPKYIPDNLSTYDFFRMFRNKLVSKLREGAIVECQDGQLRTPPTVRYVPNAFRDENNMHILGGETMGSKYMSHKFSNSDCQRLASIGVPTLSKREFLDDVRDSLSASNKVPMPVVWYSNVAKALLPLISNFEKEISDLPLIPLSNGRWVAASSGTIFFPEDTPNHTVPRGIEIFEVRRNFHIDRDCERLYKNLQVKPFSVPAIQDLILKKHSTESLEPEPSRSDLLSQALFLFRSGWKKQDCKHARLWVCTRSGTLRLAQDVYIDTDHKYSASQYLGRTTATFPFLHKSYYKGFTAEELPQWQSWLHEQLGMWVVPRLVKNPSSYFVPDLTEEFRYIIQNCHSRQYLVLLKENWSIYVQDNVLQYTQNPVRAQLASELVFCRDGKRHMLKDTSTGFFLPEAFRAENISLQPLLDIPNPQDPQWNFLKLFGVTVDDDLGTYLRILSKIQGREVSVELVHWLYEEIQGRSKYNPTPVREEFSENNYIYLPCSSTKSTAQWVALSDCVWEGPECLTQSHDLSKIYPDHRILFVKHLNIEKAGFQALVLEAKAIISSTPLSHITHVFRELSGLLPDSIPIKALLEIQGLLELKIFPLDEGGNSAAGFDDLSSGTTDAEWYIADRPYLRQSFQSRVSLLAFSLEDVQAIRRLVTVLNLENRLLSNAAKETRQFPRARALSTKTNLVYREKVKFLNRLIPESTPQRQEIVLHLENLEIWQADEILRGWSVQTIVSPSSGGLQEGYADDDGLQALVVLPKEAEALRIYLRNEDSTCLPLELAEQLADFCRVPEHVLLVYFVLSQTDFSSIENTLDRRGFPKPKEGNSVEVEQINQDEDGTSEPSVAKEAQEPKAPGRIYEKIWICDDEQHDDEVPMLNTVIDDEDPESEIDLDEMREQSQKPSQNLPTMKKTYNKAAEIPQNEQRASPNPITDDEQAESQSQPAILAPSKTSTSKRPNYISLDDAPRLGEYVEAREQHTRWKRRTQVVDNSHDLERFDRPKIIGSNIVFVPNARALPPESFSEQASEGVILPGRAQISQSGDCTIFLAVEPPNRIDSYTEFLGELYVSKLLEKHLGRKYDPNSQWTSKHRHRAGYKPFETGRQPTASFTLDGAAMTEFLIQSGSGWKRNGNYPRYHILVKTTRGGQESSFTIHPEEKEMIRRCRLAGDRLLTEVIILVRVFNMQSTASASFFVDPWSIYASGGMRIAAQNESYAANIGRAQPQLSFKQFEIGELVTPKSLRDAIHLFTSYVRDSGETWARMTIQDDERRYTYKPLGEGPFIRLLKLYPGPAHQDLKGNLEHVSLDSTKTKNPFVALSYVWGNALKPFTLSIGRAKTIRITASLHFALKRLRDPKRSVLVWADAISIDQNNDNEKGRQVRLMSTIYSSAKYVCAWLGEEGERSNSAINCLRKIRKALQPSKQTTKVPLPSAENLVWNAICKFLSRDWFRRVWIVQELVLAPKIILLCGDQKLEWDDIYTVATFCSFEAEKSNAALMNSISQAAAPVLSLGRLRNAYHNNGSTTAQQGLLTLFKDFGHTQSTQSRDKLFAFLGLACDADDPGFNPDYIAPLEDVVRRYAGVFVRRGQGMNLLYHAGIHKLEADTRFPSWVPNWVTTRHPRTVTTWKSKSGPFTAASHLKSDIKLVPENPAILTTTAYVVDRIVRVGKTSFAASDPVMYLKEAFSIIESNGIYPTKENLKDLVWKIPIGDTHNPPSGSWSKIDFRTSYEALVEYLKMDDENTDWYVEISKIRAVAKMRQFLFRPQELRQLIWLYLFTAREFAERFVNAKVCVTRKGYIGIVPGTACVGSLITLFPGSAVPFVVHESEEFPRCYRHIGESYVHGIMDGAENRNCGLFDALDKKTLYLC